MDVFTATELAYKNGYEAAVKRFSERLVEQFNDLEYSARTTRKTVKVDELREQMDWILHEVAINTIEKVTNEMLRDI